MRSIIREVPNTDIYKRQLFDTVEFFICNRLWIKVGADKVYDVRRINKDYLNDWKWRNREL